MVYRRKTGPKWAEYIDTLWGQMPRWKRAIVFCRVLYGQVKEYCLIGRIALLSLVATLAIGFADQYIDLLAWHMLWGMAVSVAIISTALYLTLFVRGFVDTVLAIRRSHSVVDSNVDHFLVALENCNSKKECEQTKRILAAIDLYRRVDEILDE